MTAALEWDPVDLTGQSRTAFAPGGRRGVGKVIHYGSYWLAWYWGDRPRSDGGFDADRLDGQWGDVEDAKAAVEQAWAEEAHR